MRDRRHRVPPVPRQPGSVPDSWGDLTGYRLATRDGLCTSPLYLSREDALDAWTDRAIEWEDVA